VDPIPGSGPQEAPGHAPGWWGYLVAGCVVVIATAACYPVQSWISPVNIAMVYLLAVVTVASRGWRGPTVFAAALGLAAFELVFVNPAAFTLQHSEYLLAFNAILMVGLLVSTLTVRLHQQLAEATAREHQAAALQSFSRDLAVNRGGDEIVAAALRHADILFGAPAVVFLAGPGGSLAPHGDRQLAGGFQVAEAADYAVRHGAAAGLGTDHLPRCGALLLPLAAAQRTIGALGLFPADRRQLLDLERRALAGAYAHQVALAVESEERSERARAAQTEAETERLRSALLSSVSHDLRTPLASITGAASSLYEHDEMLDAAARRELARTIAEEGEHLARLVANLLDMTRLAGGEVRLKRELFPVEEVIGAALTALERRLKERTVEVRVEPGLPPLTVDGTLVQSVLMNLLDNAIKYTPPDTVLTISAAREGDAVRLQVEDEGPGVPAEERERIFEKFYRGTTPGRSAGVGLGLAIVRTIVEAHGGRIRVEGREPRGARFCLTLPLDHAAAAPAMAPPP
jgi:two-component system sensor histidine kinase KdpD